MTAAVDAHLVAVEREHETLRLEGEIAEVCGLLNATTGRLVELIGRVLDTGSWAGAGIRSAEHWVAWQCGVSAGRARALVAMARRLPHLPVAASAFAAGELSEDQMLCRHTAVHNDAEVAGLARSATVTQLDRTLRSHRPSPEAAPDEPPRPDPTETRRVSFGFDGDTWTMRVRAPMDEGALIERAMTAAGHNLFHDRDGDRHDVSWLDALLHVAERSLDQPGDVSRPRRDRYPPLVHLNTDPVTGTPEAHLHGGPALPDSLRRLLTCDGHLRPVFDTGGVTVNTGRTTRTDADRTRTVIEDRDRGCRVPGCDRQRWLHIHHIVHWEDGGPTNTPNLIALCGAHHRLHHRGILGITGNADQPDGITFTDQHGRTLPSNAKPTPPGDPPTARPAARHPTRHLDPPGRRTPQPPRRLSSATHHTNERAHAEASYIDEVWSPWVLRSVRTSD